MVTSMNTQNKSANTYIVRTVKVCAWCPPTTYPKTFENERVSHGICSLHYYQTLKQRKNLPKLFSIFIQSGYYASIIYFKFQQNYSSIVDTLKKEFTLTPK